MLVSTRGRYALRVMLELAACEGYTPLRDIAARQEISEKYLESIIKTLVAGGLVTGLRGKGGGYRLEADPDTCTAWDVLRLTEEDLAPVACMSREAQPCTRAGKCKTLPLWQGLDRTIRDYLRSVPLSALMKEENHDL